MEKIKSRYPSWFLNLLPIFGCVVFVVVIYYPVFLTGRWAVNGSDALNLHLPGNYAVARAFLQGRIPLWNPHFNLGQPVIDGSTIIFHPAMFLYLIFNPWLAHTVEILSGLVLSCLGVWYFLRQQGFEVFAAVIGSLVYILSGPVFFLHSYHLGFMAILLLPWTIWVFHQHDRTGHNGWLWIAAALCVLSVYSTDPDTLFYLYLGLIIDRLVCLPKTGWIAYLTKWTGILCLAGLAGAALYLPLYEWLTYSSRFSKTYAGVLNPGFLNFTAAVFTNQWLKSWPYDAVYFYLGPAVFWLSFCGLARIDKKSYVFRYFLYSLIIPIFYLLNRLLESQSRLSLFDALDIWRSMFVFCLGLGMLAAAGVRNILKGEGIWEKLTLSSGLAALLLAGLAMRYRMDSKTCFILLIASAAILFIMFPRIRKNKLLAGTGIFISIVATIGVVVFNRTTLVPSCAWNSAVLDLTNQPPYTKCHTFTKNLEFYRKLGETEEGRPGHWRVSLLGGTDNLTAVAGLKTLPNYSPCYNRAAEEALSVDDLVPVSNTHPYWMELKNPKSRELGIYGVRFLVDLSNRQSLAGDAGWLERQDLSWPDHRVWESKYYLGRAYLVSQTGKARSDVEFLEDRPELVSLRVNAREGERLVLADLDYPGWQAFVDNQPVDTERYRGCLKSVILSAGQHAVIWKYSSKIQQIGFFTSACALLLLLGFLGIWHLPLSRTRASKLAGTSKLK